MANYPSISELPVEPMPTPYKDTTLISDTEADYIRSRSRTSRVIRRRSVRYNRMTGTSFATIETFFVTTVKGSADTFVWADPITATSLTVRFVKDSFRPEKLSTGQYNLTFELEEA